MAFPLPLSAARQIQEADRGFERAPSGIEAVYPYRRAVRRNADDDPARRFGRKRLHPQRSRKNHPQIAIEDTPLHYDMSVFNRCAETNKVLLMTECWQDVHPGLVSIPVNWDYSIPYGLLYSADAPKDVLRFVECAEKLTRGQIK